jgi:catalase
MKDIELKPLTNDAGTPYPSTSIRLPLGRTEMPCCKTIIPSKMANFKRERIPEHQPHAKGS